jgi:hypothetical protein
MINPKVLGKVMHDLAAERGEFTLFALLMRANGLDMWDLVVSAPWLEGGKLKATSEFVRLLTQSIGKKSLPQFARVVVLSGIVVPVKYILEIIPLEDCEILIQSFNLQGMQIEKAIIFRAMKAKPRSSRQPTPPLQPTKRH